MNVIDAFAHLSRPLRQRVANMVARALVTRVDDSTSVQSLQLALLEGETRDEVEHVQPYGFTSVPLKDAEAAVVFVGGKRDHGLVIAVGDRRYRLKGLPAGEVALYTDQGDKLHFKRNGTLEVVASTKVAVTSPNVEFSGDVAVSGTLTATVDVVGGGKSLKNHTHSAGTQAVSTAPGPVTGVTGAPT